MQNHIEEKFNKSRSNLLLVIGFSLINVILSLFNSTMYFLFSATIPMLAVDFGRAFSDEFGNNAFFILGTVIAFVVLAFYGICYLLSKKHRALILVALILFSIDTLVLIWSLTLGFEISMVIDIAFHGWVIYYLIIGVKAWSEFKKTSYDNDNYIQTYDPEI